MFWLELIVVGVVCYWAGFYRAVWKYAKAYKDGKVAILKQIS